ncbi:MAG: cobalt-precorrin-5B (C(1))-methyltransferase CbiD [Prevotellaceae bacterium]|nr:cobalt-precorrin-5B (C(1))-methyltransferase CbiD [Prevotellaceae bacterium]
MILVFGGTTEGRMAVTALEAAGGAYYYATKGDRQAVPLHHGIRLSGAMEAAAMEAFCKDHGIRLVVDAAHPFASRLHANIAAVAAKLQLPVIRYERIYPDRNLPDVVWCRDYEEATSRLQADGVRRLLALTGVQSIARLRPLWQTMPAVWFRILNRESSKKMAAEQGFPMERLCYDEDEEEDEVLSRRLRPDAILLKESGLSGGFMQKIEAARKMGIPVYALMRPALPEGFITVNGPHGLRRMVERLLPAFYPLHSGLTTGTCAVAAALGALQRIYHPDLPLTEVPVVLPDGETIPVAVTTLPDCLEATVSVIKDAGNDPDITDGIEIRATVRITHRNKEETYDEIGGYSGKEAVGTELIEERGNTINRYEIALYGGPGIGTVTLPGLGLEVGAAAINAVPREMMTRNVTRFLNSVQAPTDTVCTVTLSVPEGAALAHRTFNPRLGVKGGISIIGTSGIVKPYSTEAFVDTIRKAMEVARACGSDRVVINSGAKSEGFLKAFYPHLPAQAFVQYGNFIGETLRIAAELGVRRVTLGVMMGKAVKLAEGHLNTHSKEVVMNKAFVQELALQSGCDRETADRVLGINLARELWRLLPPDTIGSFCQTLAACCHRHCDPLLPKGELTVLIVSDTGKMYGESTTPHALPPVS